MRNCSAKNNKKSSEISCFPPKTQELSKSLNYQQQQQKTYEKEEVCFEGDGQLDGVDDLLAHVLRYDEGGDHDDDRRGDEPRTNGKRFDYSNLI